MLVTPVFLVVAIIFSTQLALQSTTAICSSSSGPVLLPWSNITLGDGVAFNRGIAIELGNQRISLRATTLVSNTRVRNSLDCAFGNTSIKSGCQGASGSSFDISRSSTWQDAPVGTWNVTTLDVPNSNETVIEGYDTAQFQSLPGIQQFPFSVWSDRGSTDKSGLALGLNSSFITALRSRSLIPSGAFSLFFGSRSQTKGIDGELVLGGVDRARRNGSWTNFTTQAPLSNASCPLQVLVKDVRLNNDRGSFSLLVDSGATVVACIDPFQNQFTFTQTMFNVFASLTNHPTDPTIEGGSNFTEQTYPLSASPLLGNLTVELNNGYTTHIPRYEFVSQERGTDLQGKYAVINESRLMVAAGTTRTSSLMEMQTLILGGVYLSQNYLTVDYESGSFRMAPAVLGDMDENAHDVVKVCGGSEIANTPSNSTDTDAGSKSRLTSGAIAGIVIGAFSTFVMIGAVTWYLKRKRNRSLDSVEQSIHATDSVARGVPETREIEQAPPPLTRAADAQVRVDQTADRTRTNERHRRGNRNTQNFRNESDEVSSDNFTGHASHSRERRRSRRRTPGAYLVQTS